jgi:hypothetical protein
LVFVTIFNYLYLFKCSYCKSEGFSRVGAALEITSITNHILTACYRTWILTFYVPCLALKVVETTINVTVLLTYNEFTDSLYEDSLTKTYC